MARSSDAMEFLREVSERVQAAKECDLESTVREVLCPVVQTLGSDERAPVSRYGRCWQVLCRWSCEAPEALVMKRNAAAMDLLQILNDLTEANPGWRLRGAQQELLCAFRSSTCPQYSKLVLLQLGITTKRCSLVELRALTGMLVDGIATQGGQHQLDLLHLALYGLTSFSTAIQDLAGDTECLPSALTGSKDGRGQDQQEVLRFGLSFMLYYFSDGDAGSQPERDSEFCAPEDRQPPPGLSRADADEISYTPAGMPAPEGRSIVNRKLGLLNVCAVCENLPPSDVALIALAACDDSSSEVASTGDYVLEARCSQNGIVCRDEVEEEAFVHRLFDLLAGSPDHVPQQLSKRAAPPALRCRLYHLCCTSVTACNLSPRTLEVVTVCVEDVLDPRDGHLQRAACEFLLWVLEKANEDIVAAVSQPILAGAIYALNLLTVAAPTPSPPIRRMLYKAVGQLAERAPQAFKQDVTTAAGFFGKLESEPLGLSEAVNDAVNRLQCAYTALPCPEVNEELTCMLKWQAEHSNERVRTCALVWAFGIYPWEVQLHKRMEYLCGERSQSFNRANTKLCEPDSHRHHTASSSLAGCRSAAELHRGWPEAWAAIQERKARLAATPGGSEADRLQGDADDEAGATIFGFPEVPGASWLTSAEQERELELHENALHATSLLTNALSRNREVGHAPASNNEHGIGQDIDVVLPPAVPDTLDVTAGAAMPSDAACCGFESMDFNPWNDWADVDAALSQLPSKAPRFSRGEQSTFEGAPHQALPGQDAPSGAFVLNGGDIPQGGEPQRFSKKAFRQTFKRATKQAAAATGGTKRGRDYSALPCSNQLHEADAACDDESAQSLADGDHAKMVQAVDVGGARCAVGPSDSRSAPWWSKLHDAKARRWLTCMEGPDPELDVLGASEDDSLGSLRSWLTGAADCSQGTQLAVPSPGCASRTLCALLTCADVANGMRILHSAGTLHGDLAPRHVVLYSNHKDPRGFITKLSGFRPPDNVLEGPDQAVLSAAQAVERCCHEQAAEPYIAPEALLSLTLTKKTEVYAFGVMMWELWHHRSFSEGYDEETMGRCRSQRSTGCCTPAVSAKCPQPYVRLMSRCLDTAPELRPHFHGGHFSITLELERLIREEYKKWLPVHRTYQKTEGRCLRPGTHAAGPSGAREGLGTGREHPEPEQQADTGYLSA